MAATRRREPPRPGAKSSGNLRTDKTSCEGHQESLPYNKKRISQWAGNDNVQTGISSTQLALLRSSKRQRLRLKEGPEPLDLQARQLRVKETVERSMVRPSKSTPTSGQHRWWIGVRRPMRRSTSITNGFPCEVAPEAATSSCRATSGARTDAVTQTFSLMVRSWRRQSQCSQKKRFRASRPAES